ncbi:MAG: hypothetical protein HS111_26290 [Kofleriaceae bacterium]|nr:hypothetical protein [Kofleriaceae bacterium]MCL4227290.1 hypothetical protein [Myxococcales bacterium]
MEDIIWIEDDERNARPVVRHHGRPTTGGVFPGMRTPLGAQVVRQPVVIYPNAPVAPVAPMAPAAPTAGMSYVPGTGYVTNPLHPMAGQLTPGSKLAQFATPALIEGAAKLLASFLPVPPAPTATGSVEDDVANGFTYQAALAAHAKRDEQIRTIGWLAAKLLG